MTLTAAPRLLLVHAHPDDESLWTGGTIARYAAAGILIADFLLAVVDPRISFERTLA